jgi:hypothetical protein
MKPHIEKFLKCYVFVRNYFFKHTAQVVGVMAGVLIVAAMLGILYAQESNTSGKITRLEENLCANSLPQSSHCRDLLDKLLANPSDDQIRRLKEVLDHR